MESWLCGGGPCSLPPSLLSLYLTLRPFIHCFVLTTSFLGKMYPHFTGKETRLTEAPHLVSGRAFKIAFALWKLSFTQPPGDRAFPEQTSL